VGIGTTTPDKKFQVPTGTISLVSKGGNVGIGTTTPDRILDVFGNGRIRGTTTNTFRVSTAAFFQQLNVSDQDSQPQGVTFNDDGTHMYITGTGDLTNAYIFEYNLATAYDISSAVFNQSFDVSGQDNSPQGVDFKPDGTKMYVVGSQNADIYEYNLGTAYDISTASLNQSFDTSGQDGTPQSLEFNLDGTKMFIVGSDNDSVYEYNLGTAYDISTATFSQSFDVSGQDNSPQGVDFKPDGSIFNISGSQNGKIYEYTLGTNYDISTASFTEEVDISDRETAPQGLEYNTEGTKLIIAGTSNANIYQYTIGSITDGNFRVEGTLDSSDIAFNNLSGKRIFTMTEGDRVGEDVDSLVFRNASDENRYVFNQRSAFFRTKLGIGNFSATNTPPAEFSVQQQTTTTPLASFERFETASSTGPVLHLTSDGNVAIGTSTPAAALDIQNNTNTQPVLNLNNDKGNNLFRVQNNGNIGIGTIAPSTALDINGNLLVSNTIFADIKNNSFGINTTTPETTLEVDGTSTLAGKVAINSTSPTFTSSTKLSVDGSISANISGGGGTNNNLCFNSSGVIVQCNSSKIYKKNINALDLGQNTLLKLKPKTFEWKTTGEKSLGFLAQDVEKVDKRLATYDSNGDVAGVKYEEITSLLTKAIKERNKVLKTDSAPTSYPALAVDSLGEVGIGTSTPDAALDVNGKIQADNLKGGATSLSVDSQGNIIRSPSDEKLKEEIRPVSNALQKVANLQGVSYEWKNEKKFGGGREVGLLAQKVDKVVPEAVRGGGDYISLNYDNLTALLIEAVKDQQQQIQSLSLGKGIQGVTSDNFTVDNLKVSSSSEFKDIKIEEHATFGEDTVGQAVIKKGYKEVEVNFEKKYKKQPIITAIQMGSPVKDLNYSVRDVSTAGFWITIDKRYDKDIKFNWHAFAAGEESKIHFSDGSTSTIEINVEEIKGCTNPKADNYDPNATEDDWSCKIGGCVDSLATNYDPEVTYGDKSCEYGESNSSSTDFVSSTDDNTTEEDISNTTTTDSSNQKVTSSIESSSETSTSTTTSDETDSTTSSTDSNLDTSTSDSEQTTSSLKTETNTKKTTDETAPEISINGDNPVSLKVGEEYTDQGATATDNIGGDLTNKIQSKSTVDTSKAGDYTVTYTASDSAGNKTNKDRIVKVEEKTQRSSDTQETEEETSTTSTSS